MARFRRRLLAVATATVVLLALGAPARADARDGDRGDRSVVTVVADAAVAADGNLAGDPPFPVAYGPGGSGVDLLELLRGLCPKLSTAEGAQRCLSLLTAVFNSPQCAARLLAASVVTLSSLLIALGSLSCMSILGPALVRLAALYNCVKVHHDLGYCMSQRLGRARQFDA
ncbi:hypothetical protein [Actinoplanes sp. NPDC049118]|uniref:hypothetical protein n=1 Tax=Actinoplanes sp. NPDC049118 TaxID=3155769 RepID=UPI0033CCAED3